MSVKPGRSLTISLLRAREAVMSNFRPMLARHDITEQQWRVLSVLSESSPRDASDVSERASILAPSLTRIIKTLEDRGLITRGRFDDDGRRVQLAITPAGTALIREVSPERRAIYRKLERRYGAAEMEKLLDLLDRLVEIERR